MKPIPMSEILLQKTKQTKINPDEEKLTFIMNEISIAFGDALHQETNSREIYKLFVKLKKEKGIEIETMIDMIKRAKALTKESGSKVKQKIPYFFKILKSLNMFQVSNEGV